MVAGVEVLGQGPGGIAGLLALEDSVLRSGRVGLLCNQTAFDPESGKYLPMLLAERGVLRRVFVPEHGLFAELQDQVGLDEARYEFIGGAGEGVEFVSLYGSTEHSLSPRIEHLSDLDAFVVDIQDVGARYYTFATTLAYIFDVLAGADSDIAVYIVDRPNPAGRFVEGTALPADYESFVGRRGLPHRHGLTIGELAAFYQKQSGGRFKVRVLRAGASPAGSDLLVAPSPNMPSRDTALVYSGQCLLEGTNISEGRGTTRPFQIFGAPWLRAFGEGAADEFPTSPGVVCRPLRYIPTFHKYKGEVCEGFELHPTGKPYHSLGHSLRVIRHIAERHEEFRWRVGIYEFQSERPAIEILVGDATLLGYLRGACDWDEARDQLMRGAEDWTRAASEFLIYDAPLRLSPPVG